MAFVSTGLTRNEQGKRGVTAHYEFRYNNADGSQVNPVGPEPARTNAVIANCENDFNLISNWFNNIALDVQTPIAIRVTSRDACGNGGACWSLQNRKLTVTLGNLAENDSSEFVRYLLVMEITEQFMRAQNKGWYGQNTEGSAGEGLSRFLAAEFLSANELGKPPLDFTNSNSWLNSSRQDYVNNIDPTDIGPDAKTGCSLLFIYYLFSQLGFGVNSIVAAGGATLAQVYKNLTGDSTNPFPLFKQLLDNAYPGTSTITGPNLDNPYPIAKLSFAVRKNTFERAEVQDVVNRGSKFTDAFELVLEGLNLQQWQKFGSIVPNVSSASGLGFPGISFIQSRVNLDLPTNSLIPQQIRFFYDIGFTDASVNGFTMTPRIVELDASVTISGNTTSTASRLEFLGARDMQATLRA